MAHTTSNTLTSFTVTFGLVDDNGVGYCADSITEAISRLDVSIFTIALGDGIDTQTGETEPVLVVQGSTTLTRADLLDAFILMGQLRNQRGIGFFESDADASYITTGLMPNLDETNVGFDINADPF